MVKVPRKNVKPVLVDIKKPNLNYEHSARSADVDLTTAGVKSKGFPFFFGNFFKKMAVLAAIFLVIGGVLLVNKVFVVKSMLENQGKTAIDNFTRSVTAVKNLNLEDASKTLKENNKTFAEINNVIEKPSSKIVSDAISSIVPTFENIGSFIKKAGSLNFNLFRMTEIAGDLQANWFYYLRNDGEKLIDALKNLRELSEGTRENMSFLRNKKEEIKDISDLASLGGFGNIAGNNYISYGKDLYVLEDFLDGVVDLLDSEEEKRILVLFQNSSEMRPTGGFVGSYGEIVLEKGQMKELKVEDIYWPDHGINFSRKLIPPGPLKHITKDWGIRDANWFFDFPSSASTVMNLMESSKIYKEKDVNFSGVIAINIRVLESILKFVGPVELEGYDMKINSDNFLAELQREVETGKDKQAGGNPKKILAVLAPKIINKLESLSKEKSKELMEVLGKHVNKKDIMIYMENEKINRLVKQLGLDGEIYELPSDFWGGYLAVVNANIAGGKTDAFIKQNIDLQLNLNSDGSFVGDLIVRRQHLGGNQRDEWYNKVNKNYIKIFTNPNSNIIFAEGSMPRKRAEWNYGNEYTKLPILKKIEDSEIFLNNYNLWKTDEFGKNAFGGWFYVKSQESKEILLRYEVPGNKGIVLKEGEKFEFVFDRQSGVNTSLNLAIAAPVGYRWEESDSAIYTYENNNPDSRIKIDLTLKE